MTRTALDADRLPAHEGMLIPPTDPGWVARIEGLRGADHHAVPAAAYPCPPRAHRCWGQSVAYQAHGNIWTCPCGAVRVSNADGPGAWVHRNTDPIGEGIWHGYPDAAVPWPTTSRWGRLRRAIGDWWAGKLMTDPPEAGR